MSVTLQIPLIGQPFDFNGAPFKMTDMDWSKVIIELGALGYTQARIAQECKCGQVTVSDLLTRTKNPRYTTALAILGLLERAREEADSQKAAA